MPWQSPRHFSLFRSLYSRSKIRSLSPSRTLFHYDVYDTSRYINFFYDISGQFICNCFFCFCDNIIFCIIFSNSKCSFCLTIDLDCDFYSALYCLCLVEFRPGCLPSKPAICHNSSVMCGATGFNKVINVLNSPFVIAFFL